ncbi:MAG: hypothetical protein K9M98_01500 [Cephaloticoccus sp.]|nr:hypothetical protein [Cephaloticoccus sp.]MCF7759154.1 hypothetical protein [Cephaloticoccus sp.]
MSAPASNLFARPWWRILRITVLSVGLYALFRVLPTGTNLSHMDFRVEGENVIQMCDPANPQFLPVVNVSSPVNLQLTPLAPLVAGQEVEVKLTLKTHAGKPIAPADLLTVHTELLHLMIIDPQLMDYHHVHPQPQRIPGEWHFRFTPQFGGEYRFFADFTPAATGLGLYANAALDVTGPTPTAETIAAAQRQSWVVNVSGYRFELRPSGGQIRAGREALMRLTITALAGGEVPLHTVMGAYAHVVAFDEARSGFAHLHPQEVDLSVPPDRMQPTLSFQITIPTPGRYVTWAQVNMNETELFAPFWFAVVP